MAEKLSRREQAKITRNLILDTSLELMREKPFKAIKIKDICDRAHVTTGAFYHYFDSKEDIIVQLYIRIDQEFTEYYTVLRGKDYREKIMEYLKRHAMFAEKCGLESVRNVYREQLNMKNDFFRDFSRGFIKYLLELVEKAVQRGEIVSDMAAQDIAVELMSIERGAIYTWCLTGGRISAKMMSVQMVTHYLQAMTKEKRIEFV